MKTNFPQRNSGSRNNYWPIIVLVFVLGLFFIPWTRNFLFNIGIPFWNLKNSITNFFIDNSKLLQSKKDLIYSNEVLKEQIRLNESNTALFNLLKKENDDLKNVLNRNKFSDRLLLASVLVKPFLSLYDTLIIDVGLNDGVKVDDKVLVDGSTYIGYVSEVYDNNSKVILYSSPGEKVKVLIGNNNIEKEALGIGSGNFKIEMPREGDIKEGDPIVIPAISPNVFGVVEKIEFKESNSFQSILFKSPVNIFEIRRVEVLLSNKK